MITNVRLSRHAEEDRIERLTKIATTIGFGKECLSVSIQEVDERYCLTTTGVIMAYGLTDKQLITAFVPKLQYAKKYFSVIPFALEIIIRNNQKKGYHNL